MNDDEKRQNHIKHLHKVARRTLIAAFGLIVIMLFHVLIDFFYHT